jgi:hypothetical protein
MAFGNDVTRARTSGDAQRPSGSQESRASWPGAPSPRGTTERVLAQGSGSAHAAASLSASKVVAGGMAAATSAVCGSYFGAFGTVGGAAAGSIATTVGTSLYQRSIERAGQRVRARVRRGAGQPSDTPPAAGRRRYLPRKLIAAVLGTLVVFAVGIGVVTAVEWIKGGPLSGDGRGTSVGRVLEATAPSSRPGSVEHPGAPEHGGLDRPNGSNSGLPASPGAPGGGDAVLPDLPGSSSQTSPSQPSEPREPGELGRGLAPGQSGSLSGSPSTR